MGAGFIKGLSREKVNRAKHVALRRKTHIRNLLYRCANQMSATIPAPALPKTPPIENAKPSHPMNTEEKRVEGSIWGRTPDQALDTPAWTPPQTQRRRREGRESMCRRGWKQDDEDDVDAEEGGRLGACSGGVEGGVSLHVASTSLLLVNGGGMGQ